MNLGEIAKNFSKDIKILCSDADEDRGVREMRVQTVAIRVCGLLLALGSALSVLTGLTLYLANPISAIVYFSMACLGLVLSHDLVVIGENQSQVLRVIDPLPHNAGVGDTVTHLWNAGRTFFKVGAHQIQSNTDYSLKDTWLIGPTVEFLEINKQ